MGDLLTKCEVCHALLDEEDLFCANCGTEAPQRDEQKRDETQTVTHRFECASCGASMSYSAQAGSLACPFCGSVQLVQKQATRALAPSKVVPIVVSHESAVASMRRWLGAGFWRPGDLSEKALVVSMTPVYVPYWVFDATTHTYWSADTSQTPPGARGDWFPLSGEHRGRYQGILVGASGALTSQETDALCPFDLAQAVDPSQVDLENVTVEQFAVSRKYARPLARHGLEELERRACDERYVPGRGRNVKVSVRIEGLASVPMLLPVWIMAYRYKKQVFRFLVNGQTGRSTGKAPTSWRKVAVAIGIVLAVLAVIVILSAAGR